ncbi:hypothetical protein HRbin33_00420 [bacterium HR33]|nr:hypothetical protein HRbin33_00420 [bacterium HR33]
MDASAVVPGHFHSPLKVVLSTIAGFWLLGATPLEGQLQSVPTYSFSAWLPGLTIGAEYGRDFKSAEALAHHVGLRGYYRIGRFGVGGAAGFRSAGTGSHLQLGGSGAVRLWSPLGERGALTLETGIGYLESGTAAQAATYLSVPVVLSLGLGEFAVGDRKLRPWVAARVQASRVKFARALLNQYGMGASAGMAVDLVGPAGLHLAADVSRRGERRLQGAVLFGGTRFTLGVGVYGNFRLGGQGG